MQQAQFEFCIDLLKKRSGLVLGEDKKYLIESRLTPLARSHGCSTVGDLIESIQKNPKEKIIGEITEAMTTNESLFFRDQKPFEYFQQEILPKYKQQSGKNSMRIWSAASSTGQEPYTISICLAEEAEKLSGIVTEIIATDLASKVLERARLGIYSPFEVQRGLSPYLLSKYFAKNAQGSWQVKDIIKSKVHFRSFNLLDDFTPLGQFDIIFCRNVLIYFDEETRGKIIERISKALHKGGLLFLGSTEIIVDKAKLFSPIDQCRGLYRLK